MDSDTILKWVLLTSAPGIDYINFQKKLPFKGLKECPGGPR